MERDDAARIYKPCWFNIYLIHVSHIWKIETKWGCMFASSGHINQTSAFLSSRDMDLVRLNQSNYSATHAHCEEVQAQCNAPCYFQCRFIAWLIDRSTDTSNLTPDSYCDENGAMSNESKRKANYNNSEWLFLAHWRCLNCEYYLERNGIGRYQWLISGKEFKKRRSSQF